MLWRVAVFIRVEIGRPLTSFIEMSIDFSLIGFHFGQPVVTLRAFEAMGLSCLPLSLSGADSKASVEWAHPLDAALA